MASTVATFKLPVDVHVLPFGSLTVPNNVVVLIAFSGPDVPCICLAIDRYASTLAPSAVKFESSAPYTALPTISVTLSKYVAID